MCVETVFDYCTGFDIDRGGSGFSILRGLRESDLTVPVILITARSALQERVEGLTVALSKV